MNDLLAVTLRVAAALDACDIPYTVGGSLASSFAGEPRASIDADVLVDVRDVQVAPFISAIGDDFYADADALRRAIVEHGTTNLIHRPTGIKIDLFVAHTTLDARQLARRRCARVTSQPDAFLDLHSPEDILLQKLDWYRRDRAYLDATARTVGLTGLLDRALRDGGLNESRSAADRSSG